MMVIPFLASIIVFFLLVRFNNHVYPDANHAARVLMSDISHKKPTLSLVPGVFSQEVSNYSILVREIEENTNELKQVTIYDNSSANISRVITAKTGRIYFSKNQEKLLMDLNNGEIHENKTSTRDETYRKIIFDKHRIAMDADQFTFKQSSLDQTRSDRELGAQEILQIVDSLNVAYGEEKVDFRKRVMRHLDVDSSSYTSKNKPKSLASSLLKAEDDIRGAKNTISSQVRRLESKRKKINKYWVEVHKKYSIPFACIVFILIGAPLGTMTRKGGMGVAGGISLLFFLIYWAFLIGGEKLADRGMVSPFWGVWSANIFLGILGMYLTYRGAKERVNIDLSWIQKYLPKALWNKRNNDQDS
jgi:lipopolysaccharide export system permease protein